MLFLSTNDSLLDYFSPSLGIILFFLKCQNMISICIIDFETNGDFDFKHSENDSQNGDLDSEYDFDEIDDDLKAIDEVEG